MTSYSEVDAYHRHLERENTLLRREVADIYVRPLPTDSTPGYDLWSALMEDCRAEGTMQLTVRAQTIMSITYEPTGGPDD